MMPAPGTSDSSRQAMGTAKANTSTALRSFSACLRATL